MKKIFYVFIISMFFIKVEAQELYYTDWQSEYPKGIDSFIIDTEIRYKWILNGVITEEYYTEKEGYEKVEGSEKTFYRYLLNDSILVSADGKIVTNKYKCLDLSCNIIYLDSYRNLENNEEENDELTENDKENTDDSQINKENDNVIDNNNEDAKENINDEEAEINKSEDNEKEENEYENNEEDINNPNQEINKEEKQENITEDKENILINNKGNTEDINNNQSNLKNEKKDDNENNKIKETIVVTSSQKKKSNKTENIKVDNVSNEISDELKSDNKEYEEIEENTESLKLSVTKDNEVLDINKNASLIKIFIYSLILIMIVLIIFYKTKIIKNI